MGYHTSYIPFDPATLTNRLIPFIIGDPNELTDLVHKAKRVSLIKQEFQNWAQKIYALDCKISTLQREVAPKKSMTHEEPIREATFLDRFLKRQIPTQEKSYIISGCQSGIPGFDGIDIWRRPFFLIPDETPEVVAKTYLHLLQSPESPTDKASLISREYLNFLERHRSDLPEGLSAEAADILTQYEPYSNYLEPINEVDRWTPENPTEFQEILNSLKNAWAQRNSKSTIEDDFIGECLPGEIIRSAPSQLASALNNLHPSWSVEGTTWISEILAQSDIDTSDLLETPLPFFEPLLKEHPQLRKKYSELHLDGIRFISPHKIGAFNQLLQIHSRQLIEACGDTSWKMITEAIYFASQQGLGLIEETS